MLTETWNGATWSRVLAPDGPRAIASSLQAVTCLSPTDCVAVGTYANRSSSQENLAETWNGQAWSVAKSPDLDAAGNYLQGVACSSSTNCTAVGASTVPASSSSDSVQVMVALTWDGTSWAIASTAPPDRSTGSQFTSVSCVSSGTCAAVGSFVPPLASPKPLAEALAGGTWSLQSTHVASGSLSSVSCSAAECQAVGRTTDLSGSEVPLVERYTAA